MNCFARIRRPLPALSGALTLLTLMGVGTTLCADLDREEVQTFSVASGGTLDLETDYGALYVRGADTDAVTVRVHLAADTNRDDRAAELFAAWESSWEQHDDTVRIRFEGPNRRSWRRDLDAEIEITVPHSFNLAVQTGGGSIEAKDVAGSINLRTSGGHIELERMSGALEARTSGGHIEAYEGRGSFVLRTSGGSIEVEGFAGRLEVATSGGHIELDGINGWAQGKTSGGHINVHFLTPVTEPTSFATSGGHVSVLLHPDSAHDVDAKTSAGLVSSDFPVEVEGRFRNHHVVGALNGGGPPLVLRTSGGNISIRKD